MARYGEDDGRDGWGGHGWDRDGSRSETSRNDIDEQRRVRGRPIDETWSGRAGFTSDRYEPRSAPRGRLERVRRFFEDDRRDGGDDSPYAGDRGDPRGSARSFWGRGERSPSAYDAPDDRDRGDGSQHDDQSRWEGGRYVDRRPFGAMRTEPLRAGEAYRGEADRSGEWYRRETHRSEPYRGELHGSRHEQGAHRQGMGASIVDEVKGFFGRGPKNYTRSDERIREDVCDRLTDDPAVDATHVEVEVTKGEVRLSGLVQSRYEKRRAEDIVDGVYGVRDVQNQLRVQREPQPTMAPIHRATGEGASIAGSPGGSPTDAGAVHSTPMSSSTTPAGGQTQQRNGPNGTPRR